MKGEATRQLTFSLFVAAALSAAPGKQTFTGMITDSVCANADHSQMRNKTRTGVLNFLTQNSGSTGW